MSYSYDKQGQLTSAIHKTGSTTKRTETYSYDTYGNIRSFNNGATKHTYTYGDANWKDLLTAVDGHAITYDGSGNPLSYYNGKSYTMTWSEGRRLASLTVGGKTTTYTYDLNGLRTKKVNPDGTWVKYFIADGKILGETLYRANNTEVYDMRYTFDENGEVCGISLWTDNAVGWVKYYFVKNLQGDVLAVYQYGDTFTKVAEYTYDSWGNVLTATGTLAKTNPFRYRSYYQDTETGFYYLQSRYYDPSIGRFLNADSYASTGQGFLGYNMFAYCGNNPSCRSDPMGCGWLEDTWNSIKDAAKDAWQWTKKNVPVVWDKTKQFFGSVWNNLDISVGVGQGLYGGFSILDTLDIDAGAYGNYLSGHLSEGEFSFGQELYAGITGGAVTEYGICEYAFLQDGEIAYEESWSGINTEQETITILGGGVYILFIGASFNIGFNLNNFLRDMEEIF